MTNPQGYLTSETLTNYIVSFGKLHRIRGAPPNVRYDAPEEMGGEGKCFDSHIRK